MVLYEELEVIEKMQKKKSWGSGEGGWLVMMVVNEELKLLWKGKKKSVGVRVDVNEELKLL